MVNQFSHAALKPTRLVNLSILFILIGLLQVMLFAQRNPTPLASGNLDTCSGSFAGKWSSVTSGDGTLDIHISGEVVTVDYMLAQERRSLSGKVTGDQIQGTWIVGSQTSGIAVAAPNNRNFVGRLIDKHTIELTFYSVKTNVGSSRWTCVDSPPSPPPTPPPVEFASFDALPEVVQQQRLAKNGPLLPLHYDVNDLSMRVFVKAGWPGVLDYGLDDGETAEVTISVGGEEVVKLALFPATRSQVSVRVPDSIGRGPRVGRLRIRAFTNHHTEAANFQFYGLAMGDGAVQAFLHMPGAPINTQTASAKSDSNTSVGFAHFEPLVRVLLIQGEIQVNPPTTITKNEKPRQRVTFSYTFHSNFDGGRWTIYHHTQFGLDWVWDTKIDKNIRSSHTAQSFWNGKVPFLQRLRLGQYQVELKAWNGLEDVNPEFALYKTADAIKVE